MSACHTSDELAQIAMIASAPILDFLEEYLPSPLYYLLVRVLSHSLAALSAVSELCASFITTHPSQWNAQALLPPIITILAAYLALASIYRTTSWLIRLTFWFLKWGTLFGILMATAGYFMGNAGGNGIGVGLQGALPYVGGYLSNFFDNDSSRTRPQQPKYRQRTPNLRKPKPWESFDKHQEWQYQENEGPIQNDQMQQLMEMMTSTVGQMVFGSWWNPANDNEKEMPAFDTSKTTSKSKGQRGGSSRSR